MSLNKSSVMRIVLRAAGCAALAMSLLLLYRQHLVEGFLLAFGGLSLISVAETNIDYSTRYTTRSFIGRIATGRSYRSTPGRVCDIVSYFCLAAALISWVELR